MTILSIVKAGALAVALGAGALAAAPAQAAPPPNFHFSFNFGSGGGPGMYFNYGGKPKYACLSDQQIYWQLKQAGYHQVQIVKTKGYFVGALGRWHGDWYQLVINRCDGKIKAVPAKFNDYGKGKGYGKGYGNGYGQPSFGLTLNF